jgi:hypothetical protein
MLWHKVAAVSGDPPPLLISPSPPPVSSAVWRLGELFEQGLLLSDLAPTERTCSVPRTLDTRRYTRLPSLHRPPPTSSFYFRPVSSTHLPICFLQLGGNFDRFGRPRPSTISSTPRRCSELPSPSAPTSSVLMLAHFALSLSFTSANSCDFSCMQFGGLLTTGIVLFSGT